MDVSVASLWCCLTKMPSIFTENKIRAQQGKSLICGCGGGYVSKHDGKCGHCRTRKEQRALEERLKKGFIK